LTGDPIWQLLAPDTLIRGEHEASAFLGDGAHEWEPSIAGICGGGEINIDVLRVEALPEEGHVVFPAYRCAEGQWDSV
jgi:hypothetical protein